MSKIIGPQFNHLAFYTQRRQVKGGLFAAGDDQMQVTGAVLKQITETLEDGF